MEQFEELCKQKIAIVEERDVLVNQVEEERLRWGREGGREGGRMTLFILYGLPMYRELEEDGLTQGILDDKYNEEGT